MLEYNTVTKLINGDNTNRINYVIIFFIAMIGLSQNIFFNIFGSQPRKIFKRAYIKHFVSVFFLFLLLDLTSGVGKDAANPLVNLFYSIVLYLLVFLLMHSNKIYIAFISIIMVILIVLDKFKGHFENTIDDQEVLQGKLDLIYKTNNVFVIIAILTIVIGSLTSLDIKSLRKTITGDF